MVGAARRLATELVVIIARAIQEMYVDAGARVRLAASRIGSLAGMSMALMRVRPSPSPLPRSHVGSCVHLFRRW